MGFLLGGQLHLLRGHGVVARRLLGVVNHLLHHVLPLDEGVSQVVPVADEEFGDDHDAKGDKEGREGACRTGAGAEGHKDGLDLSVVALCVSVFVYECVCAWKNEGIQ